MYEAQEIKHTLSECRRYKQINNSYLLSTFEFSGTIIITITTIHK